MEIYIIFSIVFFVIGFANLREEWSFIPIILALLLIGLFFETKARLRR